MRATDIHRRTHAHRDRTRQAAGASTGAQRATINRHRFGCNYHFLKIQHRARCHGCSRRRSAQRTGVAGRQSASTDRGVAAVGVDALERQRARPALRQCTGAGDHPFVGRGGIERASGEREAASNGDIATVDTAAAKAADGQSARDAKVGASRVVKRDSARTQGAASGSGECAGTNGCATTVSIDTR